MLFEAQLGIWNFTEITIVKFSKQKELERK